MALPIPTSLSLGLNDELNTSFGATSENRVEFYPFGRRDEAGDLLRQWALPVALIVGALIVVKLR